MNRRVISVIAVLIIVLVIVYALLRTGDTGSETTAQKSDLRLKSKTGPIGKREKAISVQNKQQQIVEITREPIFAKGTGKEQEATQIVINSADEPAKEAALEIQLDENDNPIVDANGNPVTQ